MIGQFFHARHGSDGGSDGGRDGWHRNSGGYSTNIRVHIRDYMPKILVKGLVLQSRGMTNLLPK